jgi:hypothetical protein
MKIHRLTRIAIGTAAALLACATAYARGVTKSEPTPTTTADSTQAGAQGAGVKRTLGFGSVKMTEGSGSDQEGLSMLRELAGFPGFDSTGYSNAQTDAPVCRECAGVKQALAQFLGEGQRFKIKDDAANSNFLVEGIVLDMTKSAASTDLTSQHSGGVLGSVPHGLGGILKGSNASANSEKLRMDVAVKITNSITKETRTKQFAGYATAKDIGLDIKGVFGTGSERETSVAVACADAARQAARWVEQTTAEISAGLQVWADVVSTKKATTGAKADSTVTLNLGGVDGMVNGVSFDIGEALAVRPGVFIIEEPIATVEVYQVEDYVSRARVITTTGAIQTKTMKAKLRD